MVILHVKKDDESQFLYETKVSESIDAVTTDIAFIYNGRLKISRICSEMEELAKHGTFYPPEILGLLEEQVAELKLTDEWGEKCSPSGGWKLNKDPIGRRNGRQPVEEMQQVLLNTVEEAKAMVSKKLVSGNKCLTLGTVQEAIRLLGGACSIVYPMGLPPHDPIREELENREQLEGTQASREVMEVAVARLWFSGRELNREKLLRDYVGPNDKSKLIVKLARLGQGAPAREPVVTEEVKRRMMADAFRRQEQLKVSQPHLQNFPLTKETLH
ncbi:unnamed protein product [Bemisia tabaci]|uniref:Cilia- and flagella-associated protein 298 n=1 Tax=Bemisia tabaci TaxID=7038 RepID=A0A9P0AKS2_BEMTA|nr:unnamed protein product [Bemisia tabaci]